ARQTERLAADQRSIGRFNFVQRSNETHGLSNAIISRSLRASERVQHGGAAERAPDLSAHADDFRSSIRSGRLQNNWRRKKSHLSAAPFFRVERRRQLAGGGMKANDRTFYGRDIEMRAGISWRGDRRTPQRILPCQGAGFFFKRITET